MLYHSNQDRMKCLRQEQGNSLAPDGYRRRIALRFIPSILLLTAGCSSTEPSAPLRPYAKAEPSMLTGVALAALGPDGRFNFDQPLPPEPDELSRSASEVFAQAAIKFMSIAVGGGREAVEEEFGQPIDFTTLKSCSRRVIPLWANFSDPAPLVLLRNPLGPSYLVEFCTPEGERAVSVQVLIRTKAKVNSSGLIDFPPESGDQFWIRGIRSTEFVDLTPEYGARLVFQRTHVPINAVPELDGCISWINICQGINGWHWRFRLATPLHVHLLTTDTVLQTQYVYTQAGFGALDRNEVYVASPNQPSPVSVIYTKGLPTMPDLLDTVPLTVLRPIVLERFEIVP